MRRILLIFFLFLLTLPCRAQRATPSSQSFAPLEQWRVAIAARDWKQAESVYAPAVEVVTAQGKNYGPAEDINFWKSQGGAALTLDVADVDHKQWPDLAKITFEAEYKQKVALGLSATVLRTYYVVCVQLWKQQGGEWRIVSTAHGEPARLRQPLVLAPIFSDNADAKTEIQHALERAKKLNKRVLLDFGANWCFDCQVLDAAFESADIAPLLQRNFVIVHVDVGQFDKNLDQAKLYQIPLQKGIPAIAVLNADGHLLVSTKDKEFEKARSMTPEEIEDFLNRWKRGS